MKTFKDVYLIPLRKDKVCDWVWDSNDNFVFQFEIDDDELNEKLLSAINGNSRLKTERVFIHEDGIIKNDKGIEVILIRGWGNLTGTGAMNLPAEEAANIQDTFAEFIVHQLNKR